MNQATNVTTLRDYPRNKDTSRPYRLWDAKARKPIRWRCYVHAKNAVDGALREINYMKPGTSIEVYDTRTGQLLAQYTVHPRHIDTFMAPKFKQLVKYSW